jgi:uncharacterized protein YcbX
MFVGRQPEMALFHCKLMSSTTFSVEYHTPSVPVAPSAPSQQTAIEIPLDPESAILGESIKIELHSNPTYTVRRMPDDINKWFSECFGYECILAYTGDVIGAKQGTEQEKSWMPTVKAIAPKLADSVTFSNSAALLVASESSLPDVHKRLPDGEKAVLEKFRPNIIIDGDGEPWAEDFWGELTLPRLGGRIVLTSNCTRCVSINVDLEKGRMGEGESGTLLKKLMKDRRVDPGMKWEPIFGRYGFPTKGGEIRVGDEVVLTKRNSEHTAGSESIPLLCKSSVITPNIRNRRHLPPVYKTGRRFQHRRDGFVVRCSMAAVGGHHIGE